MTRQMAASENDALLGADGKTTSSFPPNVISTARHHMRQLREKAARGWKIAAA
jgi:hypothetical protein